MDNKELLSLNFSPEEEELLSEDITDEQVYEINKISTSSLSSEQLCAQIIAFHYLGLNKDLAVLAMQELARRRELEDDFDFETFIETELKKLPDFKIDLTNLFSARMNL